jgi:16S rRNA (adenine1518-N6/adenine1519-N6)-dimethyltransferase
MAEEYFDIVNEYNEVIGQEARRIVHKTGLWHRGVHVFLFTPEGRLLVQKRSQTQDTFPGSMDCSVSEHLKVGESYLDSAVRGLQEELGIKGISLTRLVQFKMNYGPNDNEFSELYKGVFDGSSLLVDPGEVAGKEYYTISQLEEMMVSKQALFAPWFIQLIRFFTDKPADMAILWVQK